MKLVALTGLPRCGKDTFADHLASRYGYMRAAFADPLKEAAAVLLNRPLLQMRGEHGFDREDVLPEWGFSTRWFLQVLGTECLRQQVRPDFWVHRMRNFLLGLPPSARVVITDCRFDNEADLVHVLGGTVIEVTRPAVCIKSKHVSDAGVRDTDGRVENSGSIDEFRALIDTCVQVYRFA